MSWGGRNRERIGNISISISTLHAEADEMQLKARCKHTFWWRRLHEYFMSHSRRWRRSRTQSRSQWVPAWCMCAWASVRACGWSMEIRNAAHGAQFHSNASDNCHEFSMLHRVCWMRQHGSVAGEGGGAWVIGDGGRFCVWGTSDKMSGHYAWVSIEQGTLSNASSGTLSPRREEALPSSLPFFPPPLFTLFSANVDVKCEVSLC